MVNEKNDKPGKPDKDFKIHVNGIEKTVDDDVVTFDQVVRLAFGEPNPDVIYSVTFTHGREPHDGELVAGGTVIVKNNTEFDVVDTGRS